MRIGIDMDNTICSTQEKIVECEKDFMKDKAISSEILWSTQKYKEEFLNNYLETIYENAEIKVGVQEALRLLKENGKELYIITARSERFVSDIYEIIKRYLFKYEIEIDGIFINAKDKVDVCMQNQIDIMIDDNRYNYDRLIENNIKTILFDEYNENNDIVFRVSNWTDIPSKIEEMLK